MFHSDIDDIHSETKSDGQASGNVNVKVTCLFRL